MTRVNKGFGTYGDHHGVFMENSIRNPADVLKPFYGFWETKIDAPSTRQQNLMLRLQVLSSRSVLFFFLRELFRRNTVGNLVFQDALQR